MIYSIYKIQNIITNELYIGMTSDIEKRWYAHKRCNSRSKRPLTSSFTKYGIDNFIFSILESNIFDKSSAKKIENYYIDKLNSLTPNGLNIMVNGGRKNLINKQSIRC